MFDLGQKQLETRVIILDAKETLTDFHGDEQREMLT